MRTVGIGAKKNTAENMEALKKENEALRSSVLQSDKWLKECETKLKECEAKLEEAVEYAETRDVQITELKEQIKELKAKPAEAEKTAKSSAKSK